MAAAKAGTHEHKQRGENECLADLEDTLKCLEGRWKLVILSRLCDGAVMRFSELERSIPEVSQKMLVQQLRDLEEDGIVSRIVHHQVPPKVEYAMTEVGTALDPVFRALLDWAALRKQSGRAAVQRQARLPKGANDSDVKSAARPKKVRRRLP